MSAAVLPGALPSFIAEQDCIKFGGSCKGCCGVDARDFMAQLLADTYNPTIFTAETTDNSPAYSESELLGESEPAAGYSLLQQSAEAKPALDLAELAEALTTLQPSLPEATVADALTEASAEPHCYLENCHRVMENLYLGGREAAEDLQGLTQQGIRAVVCCNRELEYPSSKFHSGLEYLRVDVEDVGREPLGLFFPEATEFIHSQISQGRQVLIHCKAGVSRSASVTLAYLIEYCAHSLYDAFRVLRRIRPTITPNPGFMDQLITYEKEKLGSSKPSIDFRKYIAWVHGRTEKAGPEPNLTPE